MTCNTNFTRRREPEGRGAGGELRVGLTTILFAGGGGGPECLGAGFSLGGRWSKQVFAKPVEGGRVSRVGREKKSCAVLIAKYMSYARTVQYSYSERVSLSARVRPRIPSLCFCFGTINGQRSQSPLGLLAPTTANTASTRIQPSIAVSLEKRKLTGCPPHLEIIQGGVSNRHHGIAP